MDDLIFRQVAIDALEARKDKSAKGAIGCFYNTIIQNDIKALKDLSSSEPERKVFREMSDAEFEKWLHEHGICNPDIHESIPCDVVPSLIDNAINELPPTQPERQRGRWIEYIPEHGKCPFCGNQIDLLNGRANNFCGECGADMRGEQDE